MAGPRVGYQHFCPAARALEVVGEKWSLLVVRDLLAGPRRFGDLRRSLAAITPKWLSARLRALEQAGVLEREAASAREVWYRLTPKGQALAPVIDALLVWGIDHALGRPRADEAVHPGRALDAAVRYLERRGVTLTGPAAWVVRFTGDRSYTIRFGGARWSRERGEAAGAQVVLETTPRGWVAFLRAGPAERRRWLDRARVHGAPGRIEEMRRAFGPAEVTA